MYNADMKQSGAKIRHHLLETNRICAANQNESNFHIFYALLLGYGKNICLDPSAEYKVNIWTLQLNIFILLRLHSFIDLNFVPSSISRIKIQHWNRTKLYWMNFMLWITTWASLVLQWATKVLHMRCYQQF